MRSHSKESIKSQLQLERPVVLVGLMGAGKTTVGRRLAQQLGTDFVDSDDEIAAAAGCSVSDIFDIYGEEMFRDLEKRVITRLLGKKNCIIATGGGAFIQPHIREQILSKATAVWLRAELDILIERVSRRDTRPLLKKGDKHAIMKRLMEERYPIYEEAQLHIDSNEASHEAVVESILEELATWTPPS